MRPIDEVRDLLGLETAEHGAASAFEEHLRITKLFKEDSAARTESH